MKKVLFVFAAAGLVAAGLVAAGLMAGSCAASRPAVSSEADRMTAAHVERMINERMFIVQVNRAHPVSAPSMHLNYDYHLSVIGDRVESFLPYFGRAWSLPYGGGEGLRFAAPISDYSVTERRDGRRMIEFRATTGEDTYDFTLTVWPLGECDLTVSASRKQSISFGGRLDLEPEFEAVRVGE
jgi:hypothetical protein